MAVFVYAPVLAATATTRMVELAPDASVVVPLTVLPETPRVMDPLITCALTAVKLAGTTSTNVAPTTGLGPPLLITRVKVTVWPIATFGAMLTFVNAKSALGVTESVSAAEHTPATVHETFGFVLVNPAGGATLATFRTVVCAKAQGESTSSITANSHEALKTPFKQ